MKRILMNKNKEVLVAEYDSGVGVFTKVYDRYSMGNVQCKGSHKRYSTGGYK